MKDFNFTIKTGYGKFNRLDRLYRDFVVDCINDTNEHYVFRWEIYNIIMNELISIGEYNCFEEVKYRITDGEDPNLIMLDMLDKFCDKNNLMWLLRSKIDTFIEEDNIKRFS